MAAIDEQQQPDSHYAATVMPQLPQAQQAERTFSPVGSLEIPNAIKPVNGMSESSWMASIVPLAAKASPMTRVSADEAQQKVGQ